MNFRELQLLYNKLGFKLEKQRGYYGLGYYYKPSDSVEWEYIGESLQEVTELYYILRQK